MINDRAFTFREWGEMQFFQGNSLEEFDFEFQPKLLRVKPGQSLSLQRHASRAEFWVCLKGEGLVAWGWQRDNLHTKDLSPGETTEILPEMWHKLINVSSTEGLVIFELQYGTECNEEDIERV